MATKPASSGILASEVMASYHLKYQPARMPACKFYQHNYFTIRSTITTYITDLQGCPQEKIFLVKLKIRN